MELNIKPESPAPPQDRPETVGQTPSSSNSSSSNISAVSLTTSAQEEYPRTYSCESIYMQCYEASDSEQEGEFVKRTVEENDEESISSADFEYYRPTKGSITTMDKLSETDFDWTRAPNEVRDKVIMPIAHTMEFDPEGRVSSNNISPQFFTEDMVQSRLQNSSRESETFGPMPALRPPRTYRTDSSRPNRPMSDTERTAPAGSSTHEEAELTFYPYHSAIHEPSAFNGDTASTTTTDHSQKFLLGSSRSSQSDQTPSSEFNIGLARNSRVINYHPESELGLDSLKTSKAQQIDQMYQERNDDEGGESRCLWITCKVFTWTILVLVAVATLITAKLSVVFLTQGLLITTPVSDIIPYNSTSNSTQRNPSNVIAQKYNPNNTCHREHRDILSARMMNNPNVLESVVLLTEKKVYMDASIFVMIMIILILPPVFGFIAALYGFFRYEGVRRARLSWKAILAVSFFIEIPKEISMQLYQLAVFP